jgi:ATP-binding protein involved in chromosome partitioning
MRIAVPVANKQLCIHFGHCDVFTFFEVNENDKTIITQEDKTPPPHEPGVLPKWIGEQGIKVILAGGIGKKAQALLNKSGVEVVVGVAESNPEKAVLDYLAGNLRVTTNACDH